MDYTCIEILELDNINHYFRIDPYLLESVNKVFLKNNDVFVLQYPNGNDLSFSYGKILSLKGEYMTHSASTEGGSSGAPIIRRSKDNYIIGLHYGGNKDNKYNVSTKIDSILEDISKEKEIKNMYKIKENKQEINLNNLNPMNILNNMNPMNMYYPASINIMNPINMWNPANSMQKTIWRLCEEYRLCDKDEDLKQNGISFGLENNLFIWRVAMVGGRGSPYENGIFTINILFPSNYPKKNPEFRFKNRIYHLNVDFRDCDGRPSNGHISLTSLHEWSSTGKVMGKKGYNVKSALFDIFWLFYNQGVESPYDNSMAELYLKDRKKFIENAKKWVELYAQ